MQHAHAVALASLFILAIRFPGNMKSASDQDWCVSRVFGYLKIIPLESPSWPIRRRCGATITASGASPGCALWPRSSCMRASTALDAATLVEAAHDVGVEIVVADRMTQGPGEIFPKLPNLRAFVRCAVDIRNIDVTAASAVGVLVTRASAGFILSVAELTLGYMVDLSRGVSRATADYHARQGARGRDGPPACGKSHRHHRLRRHRTLPRRPRQGPRHGGAGRRSLRDN